MNKRKLEREKQPIPDRTTVQRFCVLCTHPSFTLREITIEGKKLASGMNVTPDKQIKVHVCQTHNHTSGRKLQRLIRRAARAS